MFMYRPGSRDLHKNPQTVLPDSVRFLTLFQTVTQFAASQPPYVLFRQACPSHSLTPLLESQVRKPPYPLPEVSPSNFGTLFAYSAATACWSSNYLSSFLRAK